MVLKEKIDLLDQRSKEIVILKDIYGYKLQEISKLKNINLSI